MLKTPYLKGLKGEVVKLGLFPGFFYLSVVLSFEAGIFFGMDGEG